MECYAHEGAPAVGACVSCGRLVCEVCRVNVRDRIHCKACLERGNHEADSPEAHDGARPKARRLYRSRRDRMLAGLCAPFADRMGIDPTAVRILWLLLAFLTATGFGWLYLILWIVIPEEPA